MSKFDKTKTKKPKGTQPKEPLKACPNSDVIDVVQFQYFDNGEKTKQGQSRYSMMIEVYCEAKFDICNPYWKRSAALLDPDTVKGWVDTQTEMSDDDRGFYLGLYAAAEAFMDENEDAEWVRIGYIEDRRAKLRYPGQAIYVTKRIDGPMFVALFTSGLDVAPLCPAAMIFDKFARPGKGRRLFYGFYDPHNVYGKTKAIAARENEVLAKVVESEADEEFARLGRQFMGGSPF